jgi:hypothetical protein
MAPGRGFADISGSAIIAWIIIGDADGFTVNPSQFYFSDGSFTDRGVVHRTANAGSVFQRAGQPTRHRA